MSSKDPNVRLNDIVENAERIEEYMLGLDETSFGADRKTMDATERCLERIAEAVVKIGAERMSSIAPDVPVEQVFRVVVPIFFDHTNLPVASSHAVSLRSIGNRGKRSNRSRGTARTSSRAAAR